MPHATVAATGADPTMEFTELKIGKRTYKLTYDFDAIARVEASTGISLLLGFDHTQINSAERCAAMLHASLLPAQPEITLEQTKRLIKPATIGLIAQALNKAWYASIAEADPEEAENAQNPPAPEPAPAN